MESTRRSGPHRIHVTSSTGSSSLTRAFLRLRCGAISHHSLMAHRQLRTVGTEYRSPDHTSRVAACPVGELRERAAELAFQASDVGGVADALEPFQHQRHLLAVLPDLFDWRLRE